MDNIAKLIKYFFHYDAGYSFVDCAQRKPAVLTAKWIWIHFFIVSECILFSFTTHFNIQSERGDSFYNQSLHEGANNWTSFKDHGVYLFHSVPTDAHGNYKAREGNKLGHRPASHGCIRLSVPDSLWFKDHIPTGTQVTIKE